MNMINLQLFIYFYFYQMEFNVLPRAKILSPHSFHKSNQTTNQTVNVILPQANDPKPKPAENPNPSYPKISENSESGATKLETIPETIPETNPNPYQAIDPTNVNYISRDVNLEEPADKLTKEDSIATINFLKLVLEAYMSNPIKYNGYIICSVPTLENLIETLTSCDDCSIDFNDFESGCCGTSTNKIIPVSKIWVKNNDTTELFKYKYSQFLQIFEQYHISLKFVYVQ